MLIRGIAGSQSMNICSCLGLDIRPFLSWRNNIGERNALCISYLWWVTNDSKTWWFKTIIDNYYPHSFCDSEVVSGLVEWFWLGLSHEMVIKMSARTATFEGLSEAGAIFSRWLTHVAGKLVSVLNRWPQFLPQCGLSTPFLSIITTWQWSPPEQAIWEREREREAKVAFERTLEITHHYFCRTLFLRKASLTLAHIEGMGS